VRLWDLYQANQIGMLILPENLGQATCCCFDSRGEQLAVGMENGCTVILEVVNNSLKLKQSWKHASEAITCVAYSPEG
jgi:WD40 repeat protein